MRPDHTTTPPPKPGLHFGPYRVLSKLGEGGMGIVYLAEHVRQKRTVAIKLLKETYASRPEAVGRFFDEARSVGRIRHPHIVEIAGFVASGGQAYYIMELLEGQPVNKALTTEAVIPLRRALRIGAQVADALHAAHKVGVLHLDIKPSNIFLTLREGQNDFVKVLDFGIARLSDVGPDDPALPGYTDPGLGTPAYMSPEQAAERRIDPRSDIYSLGVVLYEMLSGRPPFRAESTPDYAFKHMNVQPPSLRTLDGVPQEITTSASRVVMRCLEKDPVDRFQSAADLRDHLHRAARGTVVIPRPASSQFAGSVRQLVEQRAVLPVIFAVLLTAAATAALLVGLGYGRKTQPTAKPAPAVKRTAGPVEAKVALTLTVLSNPAGAEVVHDGLVKRVLGMTPLNLQLPRNSERWTLLVQREGYQAKKVSVVLSNDQTLSVELQRTARIQPAHRKRPPWTSPRPVAVKPRAASPGTVRRRSSVRRRRTRRPRPATILDSPPRKPRRVSSGRSRLVDPFE